MGTLTKYVPGIKFPSGIYLKCYFSIFSKMRKKNPDAHFEIISRKHPKGMDLESMCENDSINWAKELSPSESLLYKVKNGLNWTIYRELLYIEISNNPAALKRMKELKEMAKSKIIFLVCYEPDENQCHRSLIKKWIEMLKI